MTKELGVEVEKIDVDAMTFEQAQNANIMSVPTLVCGGVRSVGTMTEIELRSWLLKNK